MTARASRIQVGVWAVLGVLASGFIFLLVLVFDNQYDLYTKAFLLLLGLGVLVGSVAGLRTAYRGTDTEVESLDEESSKY